MTDPGKRDLAPTPDRREILKGAAALPLASLPLASILASPALAQEVAASVEMISIKTKGGLDVSGALALPSGLVDGQTAPCVLLVHEWWGLNDQIKTMARVLADEGYVVLAADLYKGVVATDAAGARFQVRNVDADEAADTLTSWGAWLRSQASTTDKLGTCGWCFGGGWSLGASLAMPVDATVIYYGNVARTAEELRALKGPVIGHFGTRDMHIDRKMVDQFEREMSKAGRVASVHWYEADHGFANPTTARYDEDDAKLAWSRTTSFFKSYLT